MGKEPKMKLTVFAVSALVGVSSAAPFNVDDLEGWFNQAKTKAKEADKSAKENGFNLDWASIASSVDGAIRSYGKQGIEAVQGRADDADAYISTNVNDARDAKRDLKGKHGRKNVGQWKKKGSDAVVGAIGGIGNADARSVLNELWSGVAAGINANTGKFDKMTWNRAEGAIKKGNAPGPLRPMWNALKKSSGEGEAALKAQCAVFFKTQSACSAFIAGMQGKAGEFDTSLLQAFAKKQAAKLTGF